MKHRGDGWARRLLKRLFRPRRSAVPMQPEEAQRLEEFHSWAEETWRWGR